MSTAINAGWLNDKNGDKFAPKTLVSQVQTNDGLLLEDKIQADIDTAKAEILDNIVVDDALSSTSTNSVQNKVIDSEIRSINLALSHIDDEIAALDDNKANKETTIKGYGITDAYTNEEVDQKFDDFVAAYITADGDTIDKLNEIASWIVDDKAGAAKIIADVTANTQKLDNIEPGAEVNDIKTIKLNGADLTPDANKAVNITVPTGTLASKNAVAESDLDAALATKINNKTDAGDLANISNEITLINEELEKKTKVEKSTINGNIKINDIDVEVYAHPTTHPVNMITGLADVATSGNYNDLINKPTIPTSLPADGGNADTVDGKHADDFAAASEFTSHINNLNNMVSQKSQVQIIIWESDD